MLPQGKGEGNDMTTMIAAATSVYNSVNKMGGGNTKATKELKKQLDTAEQNGIFHDDKALYSTE
jgi:ribosomal protein S20